MTRRNLVDRSILTHGARHRCHLHVIRPMAHEAVAVEALDLGASGPARQGWHLSAIGFPGHRRHGGDNISVDETPAILTTFGMAEVLKNFLAI